MVLNGDIIEYADYGSIEGTNVATDVELLMYFFNNAGFDLLRLSGGGPDWASMSLKPSIDITEPSQAYRALKASARYDEKMFDLRQTMSKAEADDERNAMYGTAVMVTAAHAALSRRLVKRPLPGSAGEHPSKKIFNNKPFNNKSSMPLALNTYYGPQTFADYQNGGPGQQVGVDRVRFLASQTMSTYSRYRATSYAPDDLGSNEFRRLGAGQPLYMQISTPFEDSANLPTLPLTTASPQSMDSMEGICFNIQWPGQRMHEDPATNVAANAGIYSVWSQITSANFDKTVNVDFGKVLENPYWRKMIIGNVHLRMEFYNHSAHDHMVHIIWYTNKRKGISYCNEFTQWIQSIENNTQSNRQIAADFYQKGLFQMKPPCKVLRHKKFILRACKPTLSWNALGTGGNFNEGSFGYLGGGQRKVVKMKSSSGYTLKRDTLKTLTPQLDEDTWLESTNVEEERMIFCQIIACPIRRRVRVCFQKQKGPAQANDYSLNETTIDATEVPVTNLQYADEVYGSYPDGRDPPGFIPIPGIEVDIRRKVYFKVDKEIELS